MEIKGLAGLLHALAHPTRLGAAILLTTHRDGLDAGTLSKRLAVGKSTLSSHLTLLVNSGLIHRDRTGRNIIYRVDPYTAARLLEQLGTRFRAAPAKAKKSLSPGT